MPLLLVIGDRTEKLAFMPDDLAEHVAGGLFGPETTEEVLYHDGGCELRVTRGNGFWIWNGRPDHTGVSGVLVFPRTDLWKLCDPQWQPLLIRNPWAVYPFPSDVALPWNELVIDQRNGTVRQGELAGNVLGLPKPWPPEH